MNLLEGVNSYYSTMPVGISKGDFATLKNSGKFTAYGNSSNLHSWYVGVKVGVMFEMPKKKEEVQEENLDTPDELENIDDIIADVENSLKNL